MNKIKGCAIINILLVICILFSTVVVDAKAPSDKVLIKQYCNRHYHGYKIKYFTKWNDKVMYHRANKKVVYVEIEKSISSGKIDPRNGMCWGYVKGQHYYKNWYNKRVKKGKIVTSYYIYNPYSNYEDDIVAVIDNKKIR